MKKQISRRLCIIILTTTLLTLMVNYFLQVNNSRDSMVRSSQIKINQIQKILKNNSEDTQRLEESLKEDYIIRSKTAAYILEHHPEIIGNQDEVKKVAALLQVDELHVFDRYGYLYAGSEPKYFGITFDSGDQIEFFKPMLDDTSLELVQDVQPNTVEGKLMQYTAVWQESGENIIQIGMEPVRLLDAMKKNELSYIFSMITPEEGSILFVIDKESGIISGSTQAELIGLTMEEAGFSMPENVSAEKGFRLEVNGSPSYACFGDYGDQYIGVSQENNVVYRDIRESMLLVCLYLGVVAFIMIAAILRQIDRDVIQGTDIIIEKLTDITSGNLETEVDVKTNPEFEKLSNHINQMVKSLLHETDKLSRIFELADVQVGVYEYNESMRQVRATKKLGTLLMMSAEDTAELLSDKKNFEKKIRQICMNKVEPYKDVYQLSADVECYLKIQSFCEAGDSLGIITDVTEGVMERRQLEYDRDYDLLTVLLNRRGFYRQMELLFADREALNNAVMLMMDMNRLKYINDNYGHASGDIAIQAAAGLLKQCQAPNKIMARLSGDEFVMFLYGESREKLQAYIDETHDRMMEIYVRFFEQTRMPVRLSGGYIFYPEYDVSYSQMLGLADKAMYRAKKAGNADFLLYDPQKDMEYV